MNETLRLYPVVPFNVRLALHDTTLHNSQNTMNEILRLYPVVPFNVRLALHDTTLPRGGGPDGLSPIGILKDTPIGYTTLGMQRRPDLYPSSWSTDPSLSALNFNPSRW